MAVFILWVLRDRWHLAIVFLIGCFFYGVVSQLWNNRRWDRIERELLRSDDPRWEGVRCRVARQIVERTGTPESRVKRALSISD